MRGLTMRGNIARNVGRGKQVIQESRKRAPGRGGRVLLRVGRQYAVRLLFEQLEERRVLAAGEWLVRIQDLAGTTREEQMSAATELFHAANIPDDEIEV